MRSRSDPANKNHKNETKGPPQEQNLFFFKKKNPKTNRICY